MKKDSNPYDYFFDWSRFDFMESDKELWRAFFGTDSECFRLDCAGQKNRRSIKDIIRLDQLITSLPRYNGKWLYRCCYLEDQQDFEIGEIFIPPCNLTTSTLRYYFADDYYRMSHKYFIRTLPKDKTRAHDLRVIRCDTDEEHEGEQQVNFELGTKFRIDQIEMVAEKKHIYMNEIE